ncbi:MAG: hypothetical protein JXR78_13410 [Victivallales bacterium]|nr:hypothetical protein [Victivallales bacterium]
MQKESKTNLSALIILPVCIITGIMLCSCNSPSGSYQSFAQYDKPIYGELAKRSAAYEGPARNPVIVVHGFLGSKLMESVSGKRIWGTFKGSYNLFPASPDMVRAFSHPMEIGKPLRELKDTTVSTSILDDVDVRMFGFNFHVAGYSKLINILERAGYVPETNPLPADKSFPSLFLFHYDWRRDLPENAARLHDFILAKRKMLQEEYKRLYDLKDYDIQFDVVAHSMGGLVSRYYLRYGNQDLPADGSLPKLNWAGSKFLDKVLIVGTPNSGYLDTIIEMVNGLRVEVGTPLMPPGLIATFPSYYQMMPPLSTRSVVYNNAPEDSNVNIFDPQVWIDNKWGLADPKQDKMLKMELPELATAEERRAVALDHLSKCLKRAHQFIRAMQVYATPPEDVALILFQGDAIPTSRQAEVDRKTGVIKVTKQEPGDGKILVTSTLDDLRVGQKLWVPYLVCPIKWTAVYRINAAHMGITSNPVFANNMTFSLVILPTAQMHKRRLEKVLHYIKDLDI